MQLHPHIRERIDEIEENHNSHARGGDSHHRQERAAQQPADRDHCIHYIVAVSLHFRPLSTSDYEDAVALDPRIDVLREKMICIEDSQFTRDYHDP